MDMPKFAFSINAVPSARVTSPSPYAASLYNTFFLFIVCFLPEIKTAFGV
jgi:hypothetical protein